ncbi:MAG TPA: ABC transporter ATP-binding protein [Planctomycetota bacterium]|nr:ABC transporter ATP-binding protein [Planctomycetota bacterium]
MTDNSRPSAFGIRPSEQPSESRKPIADGRPSFASSAVLELRGLELALGAFRLGPVSLELAAGDYLVLLGPSGCGKTSLLKAIAGFHATAAGQLLVEGREAAGAPVHRRGIGYVSQTADLFPHLDVAGNVRFGQSYLRMTAAERRERFDAVVALLGLGGLLDREPATLSGGEARRVALARALAVSPRLLLLDEPLGMLDEQARPEMLETLKRLHAELGTATIHVTHEREEAWALEARAAVMRQGRIEQVAPVGELFRRPATRFVAEFLGGANVLPARFEVRPGGKAFAILGWAEFGLSGAPGFADGWLLIRPEGLALAAPGSPGAFAATVRTVSDRGGHVEAALAVGGGNILRAHLVAENGAGLRAGAAVTLRLTAAPHAIPGDARG